MEAIEQFPLFDIPADKPKKIRSKWDELNEMAAVSEREGFLVPPALAAVILDVSRARIHQFQSEKRLTTFEFFGRPFLSAHQMHEFTKTERLTGRPVGSPPANFQETSTRVKRLLKERKEKP